MIVFINDLVSICFIVFVISIKKYIKFIITFYNLTNTSSLNGLTFLLDNTVSIPNAIAINTNIV